MPTDIPPEDPHEEIEIERRQVAKVLAAVSGAGAVSAFSVSALAGLGESGKIEPPEPLFVEGVRLVDAEGEPLTTTDAIPQNETLEPTTVYPEKEGGGAITEDRAAVLLVRFPEDSYQDPTNLDGTVEGYAAYSKVCTHLGCAVNGTEGDQFYCQCHGSQFDPLQGAKVTGGPAPSPLPQLPIGVSEGEDGQLLMATGPFEGPVGPQ
ncbi:Rieske iron-sulfur protein [Halorientalis sp. IM1011]|uniref:QcrA and Rieske domain-containing protein n=1 Tax=Halorientalis sp. IM1011 TaxID=1932360 RepID=UPI00097CC604|nr:Rieske (2Fe-2S) protein [Halorientalis sp. IM1011]AQL42834.1 Rieske iron-sulfur protein [Halorientalis sp. IM1011]